MKDTGQAAKAKQSSDGEARLCPLFNGSSPSSSLAQCGSLQVDIEKDLESSSPCYTFSKEGSCTWRMLQLQLGPFLSASRGVPAAGGHRAAPMAQCIPPKISFHSLSCPWPQAFPVVLKVALTQSWPDQEPGLF